MFLVLSKFRLVRQKAHSFPMFVPEIGPLTVGRSRSHLVASDCKNGANFGLGNGSQAGEPFLCCAFKAATELIQISHQRVEVDPFQAENIKRL